MNLRTGGIITLLVLAGSYPVGASEAEEKVDVWDAFRPLSGKWKGDGSGFGAVSDVMHEWEFVIQEQFLRLRTKSVSRKEDGVEDIHTDVGYLSRDKDRDRFVFRQFLSEGYVNTFDVIIDDAEHLAIVFSHREADSAGGMRVRMRLMFVTEIEYEMTLDLAMPGKDYSTCQKMRMKKVQ